MATLFNSVTKLMNGQWSIHSLSIKRLTLMGFALVALPLVVALLYSTTQVTRISKSGANAIHDVAKLIANNQELGEVLTRMERYASQYKVLNDPELLNQYQAQEIILGKLLASELSQYQHPELTPLIQEFASQAVLVKKHLSHQQDITLEEIQKNFSVLAGLNKKISQRSNLLIAQRADQINYSAEQVNQWLLQSLLIIPVTMFVAAVFIMLITKPIKLLITKIHALERGQFNQKISITSAPEINEIAEALEVMRTRLHALELQKSSFIRHISHELKTPLAAIREGTELLYDHSVGQLNNEQQEICQILRNSVSRLQKLIEDLLDFNVVLDSTSLQDSERINVSALIQDCLQERKLDIKRKQLNINYQLANVEIYSNKKQLQVVIDNLLSNAIKFSEQEQIIDVETSLKGDNLTISISDHGPGIEAENQSQVFDAFFQGSAPENALVKGSGLGLTIVDELLMRLNGNIMMTSQTEQPSGTTFKVTLPRAVKQINETTTENSDETTK